MPGPGEDRAGSDFQDTEPRYSHIFVPLDGSDVAERILPHAEAFGRQFGAAIVLLRVTRSVEAIIAETMPAAATGFRPVVAPIPAGAATFDPRPLVEAEEQQAAEYLDQVARGLQERGVRATYELRQGTAADAIVERAREVRGGLIAMTTHGRGGLGRIIFGSVADAVLRHAPCPVLLVRVAEESPSEEP
ncbi:MAG: universal stress protein [Herpetosiphonaceae bacterium]|nr:MAG: universal stress protein [Herpetosiphonaceae bacterium]